MEKTSAISLVHLQVNLKMREMIHSIRTHEKEYVDIQLKSNLASIEQMLFDSLLKYPLQEKELLLTGLPF